MTYSRIFDLFYLFIICSLIYIYFNNFPLNVDSSWGLYVASQFLNGKKLYIDLIEVNPPLIFLYSSLAIYISKIFSISDKISYILLITIMISISTYLSYVILNKIETIKKNIRFYLYGILFIIIFVSGSDFGEREHLLVIFTLPYILFSMFRYSVNYDKKLILLIIIFAALGFNLKPHFYLMFIFIELTFIIYTRNLLSFIRWDFFLLFSSGLIYISIIYIYFPEYISFALPLAVKTYSDLFNKPLEFLLLNNEILVFTFVTIIYIYLFRLKASLEINVLFISILSLFIIYLLQQKGWFYHRLPYYSYSLLLVLHLVLNYINKKYKIYFLALIPFLIIFTIKNITLVPRFYQLEDIVKTLPQNAKIHIYTVDIARSQILLVKNQEWASRFGTLSMLIPLLKMNDLEIKNYFFNSIYEDLLKYNPDILIFDKSSSKTFNYFEYFYNNDSRLKYIYDTYYKKTYEKEYTILKKIKDIDL